MRDADSTAQQLRKLKALGVRIAIDDFGTGYSSLAYLRQFPVDVDRVFVTGLTDSADSRALAHTLIQLGKTLGLKHLPRGSSIRLSSRFLGTSNATSDKATYSHAR
jgi:EAL domain-containing protein (putative c-di-GMP-specific phosphodiesterase class I)